jgi:uncharacterized protein (TIGR02147 family)
MAKQPDVISVFDFTDYKRYLSERLEFEKRKAKITQAQFANAIGCQASYVSQVLTGKPNLTLEQAIRANEFFSHPKNEAKLFVLLLEHAKAGTSEARAFFKDQIDELLSQRFNLKKRLNSLDEIDVEHQNRYYSAWYYIAIHMLLLVPGFQDARTIGNHLHLPVDTVVEVLSFLEETGLIVRKAGHYELTKLRIHLNRESHFIQRHHVNWRSQCLRAIELNLKSNLHYSNVIAISKKDFETIKEIFVRSIEEARALIGPSKEEALYAVALDLFEL